MPLSLHIAKLLEKLIGKPFGRGPTERITSSELAEMSGFMDEHFGFLDPQERTVSGVLEAAGTWAMLNHDHKLGLIFGPLERA